MYNKIYIQGVKVFLLYKIRRANFLIPYIYIYKKLVEFVLELGQKIGDAVLVILMYFHFQYVTKVLIY